MQKEIIEEQEEVDAMLTEGSILEPTDEQAGDIELDALLQTQAELLGIEDDLDSLLSESIALRDEAAATKGLREKLKRGGLAAAERAEIEASIRDWEARREWDTIANVAVWEKHECQCGGVNMYFSHVMHKQQHKEQSVIRYVATDKVLLDLPNLVAVQGMTTPMCPGCADREGFDLTKESLQWEA